MLYEFTIKYNDYGDNICEDIFVGTNQEWIDYSEYYYGNGEDIVTLFKEPLTAFVDREKIANHARNYEECELNNPYEKDTVEWKVWKEAWMSVHVIPGKEVDRSLKAGDIVVLKSGSPKMTISKIVNNVASLVWYDKTFSCMDIGLDALTKS